MNHLVLLDRACAIGTARRSTRPDRENSRRVALKHLCHCARAELGIPTGVVISRQGINIPYDLDALEVTAYDRVIRLAATVALDHDLAERKAIDLLYDLIALEASPTLTAS
jgi:hypothetical protein